MGTFEAGGAGAGGPGGSDGPAGLLADRSISAGPISAEQKLSRGRAASPWCCGHHGHAWHRALSSSWL